MKLSSVVTRKIGKSTHTFYREAPGKHIVDERIKVESTHYRIEITGEMQTEERVYPVELLMWINIKYVNHKFEPGDFSALFIVVKGKPGQYDKKRSYMYDIELGLDGRIIKTDTPEKYKEVARTLIKKGLPKLLKSLPKGVK